MKNAQQFIQEAKAKIHCLELPEARKLLSSGNITLLDVREKVEHDAGHIEGSAHISRGVLEMQIGNHPDFQNKDAPVIVYCKSGGRSALAAATLQDMGYTNLYSLEGGFDAWSKDQAVPEGISD
jgi:rhodanese-related sulfurtransferase